MQTTARFKPAATSLDRLFEDLLRPVARERGGHPPAFRVDVRETGEGYLLQAELPGVRREDIVVEIEANEVAIGAETKRDEAPEGHRWLRTERAFGKRERRFALPAELDEATASARFADGVLELTLPRKASATRRIEVA